MAQLKTADWAVIEALRARVTNAGAATVEAAAQDFVRVFATEFASVVLARMFVLVPYSALPQAERDAIPGPPLTATTHVLDLLGTAGRREAWNHRTRSSGHRAIPLLDATIAGAPMIARLLTQLEIDLTKTWTPGPVATRALIGSKNRLFFVEDAATSRDEQGRTIINAEFARTEKVRSVFGMVGDYLDGMSVVAIVFTDEALSRADADRYGSLIGTFKIATMELQARGRIWS